MDYKPLRVSRRSNIPDTKGHNRRTCQTGIVILNTYHPLEIHWLTDLFHKGNESAENFRQVVGQFIYGNRGHISKVLQPPVHQPTGSVATEVVTSVATPPASSRASALYPSVIKAESQDLPPLNAKKRAAESSTLPPKRHRYSYSNFQILGRS